MFNTKSSLLNSRKHTQKSYAKREDRHPDRKWSGSILSTPEPAWGEKCPELQKSIYETTEGLYLLYGHFGTRTLRYQLPRQFGYGPEVSRDISGPYLNCPDTSGMVPNRLETFRHWIMTSGDTTSHWVSLEHSVLLAINAFSDAITAHFRPENPNLNATINPGFLVWKMSGFPRFSVLEKPGLEIVRGLATSVVNCVIWVLSLLFEWPVKSLPLQSAVNKFGIRHPKDK